MDHSLPGSSVHGILQARILEWVAMSFSRGSSRPRDRTQVSRISYTGRWVLYHDATWEALFTVKPNSLNKENPGCDFFFPSEVSVLVYGHCTPSRVQLGIPGQEDSLEEEMATHSSIRA